MLREAQILLTESFDYKTTIGFSQETLSPTDALDLALNKRLQHLCHSGNPSFANDLNTSALMLSEPNVFLGNPLASILTPTAANPLQEQVLKKFCFKFSTSQQKVEMLDGLTKFTKSLDSSDSLMVKVHAIIDELFTNAIFNAPFVKGTAKPDVKNRNQVLQMHEGKSGEIFAGSDGKRLVFGCRDPYGSLDLTRLLVRVRDCYKDGVAGHMNMGNGGAGIGSFLVFHTCSSYYAGVHEGNATVICCSLPLRMSNRERETVPKNFHWFQISERSG